MRMDSHPGNDPDGLPVPIQLLGGVVNVSGSEAVRAIRSELDAQLGPFLTNSFANGLSVIAMSTAGNIISSNADHDKATHIEGFEV